MDYIDRFVNGFGTRGLPTSANVLKFTSLERPVQQHLQRVYATLAVALAICAAGCALDVSRHIGGIFTFLGSLGCMVGLGLTPSVPATLNKRYGLLAGFSFCQGASLGPLVGAAISVNPGLVFTAFAATSAVFASFSLAALLTNRRSYLFLGGLLSSAISGMAMLRLCSWMFNASSMSFQVDLYMGLIVFAGYIIYDTQIIVEKASAGFRDHVKHALDLLVDIIAIFVRVLVILMRNADKSKEREEEQRRKRRS